MRIFLSGVFRYMKAKRKTVACLAIVVSLLFLIVTVASRSSGDKGEISQMKQLATASGGSTINQNQAGRDLTINQGGLSDEDRDMIREAVKKKSVEGLAGYANTYRHGYLIFGLSPDGRPVTYQSALWDIQLEVDWSSLQFGVDMSNHMVRVRVPSMFVRYSNGGTDRSWNNVETLSFEENKPIRSLRLRGMYYEILDTEKRIFLIGFK